jgi:putative nucleotidyltransferase with HDIG domain
MDRAITTIPRPTAVRTEKPWVLKRLRPLPAVAARLMRLVSGDDIVLKRVADLIRVDTAFSAEVLRLANSPLMGCRRHVYSILHAVAILGLDRLKSFVMMVALRNFLRNALETPVLLRCWRHSLATALLCEELGESTWLDKDQCYTAGFLHDLGRLSLLASFPEDYSRLLQMVDETDCDIREAERTTFGIDHCEIGRWLAAEWEFPPEFLDFVGHHHDPVHKDRFDIGAAVRISCRMADILGFQVAGSAPLIPLAEIAAELPEAARAKLPGEETMLVNLAGRINALECSLLG